MQISKTSLNIASNFAGKGWNALMSLAFVPIYVKLMGIEAYGIVGIYLSLQAIFSFLDFGLSTTLNRELSRMSVASGNDIRMHDTARTLEILYWGTALAICALVLASASGIGRYWVSAKGLKPSEISRAIVYIGFAISLQWPFTLYSGGLAGLQRQVLLNAIIMAASTVRAAGAIFILTKVACSIHAFFLWQIFVSFFQTAAAGVCLHFSLPKSPGHGRFNKKVLKNVWQFAAGMTGITILTVIMGQLDKVVLSKTLSLEMFGYYTFATTVAGSLNNLATPLFLAIFPRFSQLISLDDQSTLRYFFHHSCQLMSAIMIPATVLLAVFSKPLLILWTNDPVIAQKSSLFLTILAVGNGINGLMNLPVALQLAYAWTSLTFRIYLISALVGAPAVVAASLLWGGTGAAGVWCLFNLCFLVFGAHFMYKRVLVTEKLRWYLDDIALPLISVGIAAIAGLMFIDPNLGRVSLLINLICLGLGSYGLAFIATPILRLQAKQIAMSLARSILRA